MGKRPKRTGPRETTIHAQSVAVESTIPYYFVSPESGTIASANYDPDTEVLTIAFKVEGKPTETKTYQYSPIPKLLWIDFLEAPSKGKFFSARIRPFFAGKKVD